MTVKTKRKLKDIDFSGEQSHIAFVTDDQGGPANGANYALVIKNADKQSDEFLEKASKIRVEMSIEEYLDKFYNVWGSDAVVLARVFGFDIESEDDLFDYDAWINERVASVKILKSLKESDNLPSAIAELDAESTLSLLKDQETFEKSYKEFDASNGVDNSAETKVEKVEPVGSKTVKKGKKMADVETIEKSKYVEIEKQMQAQKEELEKARELLKAAEVAKQEQILKAKTASVAAVVGNDEQVQAIMKAAGNAEQADFEALVAVFKSMKEAVEKSALFNEQGASGDAEVKVEKSKIKQALAEKYAAKK